MDSRAQRLLQAKKKLRKFQEEHAGQREESAVELNSHLRSSPPSSSRDNEEPHISEPVMVLPVDAEVFPSAGNQPETNGHLPDPIPPEGLLTGTTAAEMLQLNNENYQPSGATAVSLDFTNDISNQLIQQNNENYVPSGTAHTVSLDFMNDISGQSMQRVSHKSGNEAVAGSSGRSSDPLQTITMSGIMELKVEMAALKECVSQYRQEIVHLNELLQFEKRKGNSYELEKSNMASMNQKLQGKIIQLTIENEKLSAQDLQLRQEIELLRGDNSVLSEKLVGKDADLSSLQCRVSALTSELNVARVNLEQIKNSSVAERLPPDYDLLKAKCDAYLNELTEYKSRVMMIKSELESSNEEHQRYIQATSYKIREMEQQLTSLSSENKMLMVKEASLEQDLIKTKADFGLSTDEIVNLRAELAECKADLAAAQGAENDRAALQQQIANLMQDNDHIVELLQRKDADLQAKGVELNHLMEQIASLQEEMSQFSREKYEALVNTMQSDKVATSRALAQNKQMKERLFELEQRFVTVMDEKLAITEELESLKRKAAATPAEVVETVVSEAVPVVTATEMVPTETLQIDDQTVEHQAAIERHVETIVQLENQLRKALEDLSNVSEERGILQETVKELLKELQGKASKSKRLISLMDKRMSHFDKERIVLRSLVDELLVLLPAFLDSDKNETSLRDKLLELLTSISSNQLLKVDSAYVCGDLYRCAHCMGMVRVV